MIEGGQEIQSALGAIVVFANLGDAIKGFVVGAEEELGIPKVAFKAFGGPDNVAYL